MPDQRLHFLVQAVGLLLEGIERLFLGKPAQADALTQLVDLGEVFDPDGVDGA